MASAQSPLQGLSLISCARASAAQGAAIAAEQCGYGNDYESFSQSLIKACQDIGVDISEFSDLSLEPSLQRSREGIEISPDSFNQL